MTQAEKVIKYMEDFGSITQVQALGDIGVMRLASRISDLKKAGYNIESDFVSGRNRYGDKVSYKKYWLGGNNG